MKAFLSANDSDNPKFISNTEIILQDRIAVWTPFILGIIKIDNWFDSKWLKFSGQVLPGLTIWKNDVTIPPFNPNRIISEYYYKRLRQTAEYELLPLKGSLHKKQPSRFNIDKKIVDVLSSALLIWYSGNTAKNSAGSMMGYYVRGNACFTFYLTLTEEADWNVKKSIGLTKKEVQTLLSSTGDLTNMQP